MLSDNLDGLAAIVTGATAGVGLGIATVLAERGARVAIVARRGDMVDALARRFQDHYGADRAIGIVADVGTAEGCTRIVEATKDQFGSVDILVNNAGRPAHRPFVENDDDEWHADFELKVMAAVRLSRLAHPIMKQNGGGRIINILSMAAKVFVENGTPTAVTRAGGLALTKVLSKEFAKDNVLVNAVLLGFVKSDQWVRRAQSGKSAGGLEDIYGQLGAMIPLGRVADAEEVGEVVSFLASERARYITGAALNCDGGLSAMP